MSIPPYQPVVGLSACEKGLFRTAPVRKRPFFGGRRSLIPIHRDGSECSQSFSHTLLGGSRHAPSLREGGGKDFVGAAQLEMFPVLRHQCARNCFCLKLSLDSMEPTLKRVTVEWREGRRLVILRGDNPRIAPLLIDRSRDFSIQGVVIRLVCREL